jgi:hypothetical protein
MKAGDIVYLKSGSPPLVIAGDVDDDGEHGDGFEVAWITPSGDFNAVSIPKACLTTEPPHFIQ